VNLAVCQLIALVSKGFSFINHTMLLSTSPPKKKNLERMLVLKNKQIFLCKEKQHMLPHSSISTSALA
jgi:hypothetical protein